MLNHKAFVLDLKSVEDDEHRFSGYASTFHNVDRVGDVVMPGAFAKSLKLMSQSKQRPALLLHHDLHRPIGVWETMAEDEKGLAVTGRLTKGVRDADEAYALLKDGAIHSLSIGYIPVDENFDPKSGVNYINEVELHEVSLVTIPANPAAVISTVKDAEGNPNIRELERVLRDVGLSRREAKAFISCGIAGLRNADAAEMAREAELKHHIMSILTEKLK
jgi:uncharacterized protein